MKREKTVFSWLKALLTISAISILLVSGCKKDDDSDDAKKDTPTTTNKEYVLIIENGAQTILPGETMEYSAILVDSDGMVQDASSVGTVTWTTSSNSIATISSSGSLTVAGVGFVTITASITIDGKEITATVPLGIYAPSAFTVAPSAILYEVGGSIQLEAIHLSTSGAIEPTCTYSSDNTGIATVSSTGLVEFNAAGECTITVTATDIDGTPSVMVPVMVIGLPEIELPVTRVDVNPPAKDLFKDETQQLTARAFKDDGSEATDATFTWTSLNTNIATVDENGLVTPIETGTTYIQAVASGIIGQAEIIVNPDTIVIVEPFFTSLPAGSSKQFTATAYHVTRTNATPYEGITFDWMIPTYGIPMFDIATVNSTGLVTMNSDATAGMMTFVAAMDHNNQAVGGVATIMSAIADDCDCGEGNPEVNSIEIANSNPISMTVASAEQIQLNVAAYDASSNPVAEPNLVFCSDNFAVVDVDEEGLLTATGEGTATIKVCSGSYAEATITVNVTFMK